MTCSGLADELLELRGDQFPAKGLEALRHKGLLAPSRIADLVAPPDQGPPDMFDLLVAVGRGDLALGRLFEGHVNAVGLVARYGTPAQQDRLLARAAEGGLFGVWGADDGAAPARLNDGELSGRKLFASGAGSVNTALIPVKDGEGATHMVACEGGVLGGGIDPTWWDPLGMETTDSHRVEFADLVVDPEDCLGGPGDYFAEPFFTAGAIRFVAVQLGGLLAVLDAVRGHLTRLGRHEDPHQAARLGAMVADAEAAYTHVRAAYTRLGPAIAWERQGVPEAVATQAHSARMFVVEAAGRVMDAGLRSVGCAGLNGGHPLERSVRDLMVYLRQPAPDAALCKVGGGFASSGYTAVFDAA